VLIELTTQGDDIVLDFFAGSGTTGHAVYSQNVTDDSMRRSILVQLPEPLSQDNKDQKVGADFCDQINRHGPVNIAELTKERLRRAGKRIRENNPAFAGDIGFRVFMLDSSNIRAWESSRERLDHVLLDSVNHLKADRTEADIIYELLLKLGLDLCVPIVKRAIAGKDVHAIGGGALFVCPAIKINRDEVEQLARGIIEWHKELSPAGESTFVFLDRAFVDDVTKTNVVAILEQYGLGNVRSI